MFVSHTDSRKGKEQIWQRKKQETGFSAELLDELLEGQDPATVLRSDGLVGDLKKALAERMLNGEMDVHRRGRSEQESGNHRNGSSRDFEASRFRRGPAAWLSQAIPPS